MRKFEVISDANRKNKGVDINLPTRATSKSSGYDFYLPIQVTLEPDERILVWSDVKLYLNGNEELLIFPRSSLGIRGIIISNTIGKIDSDYVDNSKNEGNIGITLWNTSKETVTLNAMERVCQGSIYKYLITDDDMPISNERVGGMGSTGML